MPVHRRPAAIAGFLFALAVITVDSQQTQERTGGGAVAVDFFAYGSYGPVFDLRPDEITLKVDSRAREIRSLRYVRLPPPDPAGIPVTPPVRLDPPYGTNLSEDAGRWVTVVVDHDSIRAGAEKNVMNSVVRFLNALGPRDQVSYVTMPHGGVEVQFTSEHQKVTTALRRFVGLAPRTATEQERSCRSRLVLNGMRDLLEDLAALEGPKIVVLLSSGVLNPRRDAPINAPPGPCEIRLMDFQEVRTAAAQARAYVFVVQPDDLEIDSAKTAFADATLSRFAESDKDRAGLESLAGAAAGEFFRIVGPDDNSLPAVARATAGYYIATFDPEPGERNGFTHRVEVTLSRENVRVRTRPEVVIPKPALRMSLAKQPREILRDPVLYRALPLRVVAYSAVGPPGKLKIMSVAEPAERGVTLESAVFGLIDSRSQLVAQWTANARELSSVPLVTAGEAVPGVYRLKVAAVDTTGRQGSVEYDVLARLTEAGPLMASDIALGTSRDGSFVPRLVFGTDQAAVVFFEVYGPAPAIDAVTVRLEVAAGPDGRALATAAPRIMTASEERRMVVGSLPIAALPPDDYTVRAIVSVDGRPVARIMRTLRKTPSGS